MAIPPVLLVSALSMMLPSSAPIDWKTTVWGTGGNVEVVDDVEVVTEVDVVTEVEVVTEVDVVT